MTDHDDLRAKALAATPGPYFVAIDDAEECGPHRNSGLSLVDTGRNGDWPIARFCETPSAQWIAATDPQTILALLDEIAALRADADRQYRAGAEAMREAAALACEFTERSHAPLSWGQVRKRFAAAIRALPLPGGEK